MKKLLLFLLIPVLAFSLAACDDDEKTPPTVEYTMDIEAEADQVEVGNTIMIYSESDKPGARFEYSSSDESIATVNSIGMVTGISVGEVTITVTLEDVGEEKVTITVIEKAPTPEELKTGLIEVLNTYLDSNNGSIKITANAGAGTMESETIFNYSESGAVESFMYKFKADYELHVYVKDGYYYLQANDTKEKRAFTTQEEATLKSQYAHDRFLADATAFYEEDAFYDALEFDSRGENTLVFLLNISEYKGNVLNATGASEVKIIATYNNEKVVKVEVRTTVGETTKFVTVEYRGTGVQTINYPSDLETYGE